MDIFFLLSFLISEQKTAARACQQPSPMPPVVDNGNEESDDEKNDDPHAKLLIALNIFLGVFCDVF